MDSLSKGSELTEGCLKKSPLEFSGDAGPPKGPVRQHLEAEEVVCVSADPLSGFLMAQGTKGQNSAHHPALPGAVCRTLRCLVSTRRGSKDWEFEVEFPLLLLFWLIIGNAWKLARKHLSQI